MEYIKLKKSVKINDYIVKDHVIAYTERLSYSQVQTESDLLQVIPKRYRDKFSILIMEINDWIPPHTDSGILTTINFYLEPGGYITKFWKLVNNNPNLTMKLKNQTNGQIFSYEALEFISEFTVEPDEAYLLNVTQIHSVEKTPGGKRIALCVQTSNYNFAEVKYMLEETGFL